MQSIRTPQRLLFLYLSTGGGHVSSARALAKDIEGRYKPEEIEVHVVDAMGGASEFSRRLLEKGYTVVSVRYPFIWPVLYQISKLRFLMRLQTDLMRLNTVRFLTDYIREHKITRIVLLHFLLIRPIQSALFRLGNPDIPVSTVVTDPFTVHRLWSYNQEWPLVVFSEEARRRISRQLPKIARKNSPEKGGAARIVVLPPLIDAKFESPLNPAENYKNRLEQGFDPNKKLLLLAGGGDGLPGGESFLAALAESEIDAQIAMVCGKNKNQYRRALKIAEANPSKNIKIYGFVKIMYQLMNMADVIVAKGGPATVFEALSLKKPLLIASYFYGQERGNMEFVVRNGYGWYEPKPDGLVRRLESLLNDPAAFAEVEKRLAKVDLHIGSSAIADHILNAKN